MTTHQKTEEQVKKEIMDRWNQAKVKKDDTVWVSFRMKIDHVTSGTPKTAQIFGFTADGLCVSAPLNAVEDDND